MCWDCDHPEATQADYHREVVLPIIERCGWFVQGVGGDRLHAPFAYTVGLTLAGLPELLVTGLPPERAATLLNGVAAHWLHTDPLPAAGLQLDWLGRRLEVVDLPTPWAHLFTAVELYGEALRAQQLVWADERGRWPWERGHRAGRGGQPVLGPRAVPT